jgi:tetratricopeptide (TPR) repeat protein
MKFASRFWDIKKTDETDFHTKNTLAVVLQGAFYFSILVFSLTAGFNSRKAGEYPAGEKETAVEEALTPGANFFGAAAIVPFPTAEARARLAAVAEKYPDDGPILLALAGLDEKLGHFAEAEAALKRIDPPALTALAAFYERRGRFADQAATLEKTLDAAPAEKRGEAFAALINLSKKHDLKNYLAPEFYQQIIARPTRRLPSSPNSRNSSSKKEITPKRFKRWPTTSQISPFEGLLFAAGNLDTRRAGPQPRRRKPLPRRVRPVLGRKSERRFLPVPARPRSLPRLSGGAQSEIQKKPGRFETAVRLIHFEHNDGGKIGGVVGRLESARAAKRIGWQPAELLALSHFLLERATARKPRGSSTRFAPAFSPIGRAS